MKIIVIGLGNFGNALALSLTETGNEVIAIDKQMEKINLLKRSSFSYHLYGFYKRTCL